jgi:hypothetical protein
MNVFGQLVHVEEFHRDGVHYRLAVVRVQGGMHGRWSCNTCTLDDDQDTTHPSVDETVRAIKQAIENHHQARHATLP